MGLLDDAKKEAPAQVTTVATEGKKKHNNSEYQKKQRELLGQRVAVITKWVDKQQNVPEDVKDALDGLNRRGKYEKTVRVAGAAGGPSVFTQLFGDKPKVGDKVTAIDMFNKVHKGFADMRKLMKKWADSAKFVAEVVFDEEKQIYEIKKLA